MNTRPHTHFCPFCQQGVECESAKAGGCLFDAIADMTCNPCADRNVTKHRQVLTGTEVS